MLVCPGTLATVRIPRDRGQWAPSVRHWPAQSLVISPTSASSLGHNCSGLEKRMTYEEALESSGVEFWEKLHMSCSKFSSPSWFLLSAAGDLEL